MRMPTYWTVLSRHTAMLQQTCTCVLIHVGMRTVTLLLSGRKRQLSFTGCVRALAAATRTPLSP